MIWLKSPDKDLSPVALQALQAIYHEVDILWGEQASFMAVDESHAVMPNPLCALTPRTHEQVVQTVEWALMHHIAIVPSGGRTGLSGGACAGNGEVVLCLSKMNHVIDFDVEAGLITVEAGMVLETLQNVVQEKGWFYPVDYASRGSAQMGGAVATNAGGIRVLRYGMTRNWVAGLKAVTGTGQTLSINRHLEKDNAGYDLKSLLIGSEGTLAVITEITFRLARPMHEQKTLLIGFENLQSMLAVFLRLRKVIEFNAAEFFCSKALAYVTGRHHLPVPFSRVYAFYLLIEFDKDEHSLNAVGNFLEGYDVLVSHGDEQSRSLWQYRELISSVINPLKPYKNDVACNLSRLQNWFLALQQGIMTINADVDVVWFGHLGDGNVHINIIKPDLMDDKIFKALLPQFSGCIAEITSRFIATGSAEHGIGLLKKEQLLSSRSVQEIDVVRHIKQVFDPQEVLNPGKLL